MTCAFEGCTREGVRDVTMHFKYRAHPVNFATAEKDIFIDGETTVMVCAQHGAYIGDALEVSIGSTTMKGFGIPKERGR